MHSLPDIPCPVELHHARAATDGLLLLYRRREECALVHGCGRDNCAIGHRWPGRRDSPQDATGWRLFGFIALAFAGPRGPH